MKEPSKYYDASLDNTLPNEFYREAIGGMWEEMGKLQFNWFVEQGLLPSHKFLDVGCGPFRGGSFFLRYLERGGYYGVDVNRALIDAGIENELTSLGLEQKLLKENILVDDKFRVLSFGVDFDYALAQSVFSHLPLNHIRLCLIETAKCMKPGGRFYATFFEVPNESPIEEPFTQEPGGVVTYPEKDPYHYRVNDFACLVEDLPWELTNIGDWGHPRNQKMLLFRRTG